MQQDIQEHRQRAERIETLIQHITTFPDEQTRATAQELVALLLDLYGEGLARVIALAAQAGAPGQTLIQELARDEMVGPLLLLHGLHPVELKTRINQALDEVRPYLRSHGGNVDLLDIQDGTAHLRFAGSCAGCSSSANRLKTMVEDAINVAAPDLDGINIEEATTAPRKPDIPIAFVQPRRKTQERAVERGD